MSFSQTKKDNKDNSLVLISSLIQQLENLIRLNLDEKSEILNLTSKISTEITQTAAKIKLEPSKFVKLKLQKDFSALVQRFEKVSKDAASKKKQIYSFNTLGKSADLSDFDQGEDEQTPLLQGQKQVVKLDHEIEFNEALIQEREQDLESIEKSVAQVNEIFRDLGTLVHEQQYMLDNIESNVTSVAVNAENATGELRRANQYAMTSRNRIMCLLTSALMVLAVLVLMLQPWRWQF